MHTCMQAKARTTPSDSTTPAPQLAPVLPNPRQVSDEPTLHDVHEQLKRVAAAAARRASRKSTTVNGLTDVLSCEAFEELKAKNRAFRLRDAAENSEIALKQADYELKIVLAGNADFVARGGTMSQEMDDKELYAHHGRGEAAKDARTSWQLVQEALLVVEDCKKVVNTSKSIVRKAEEACIVARRVAAHLQDKADRAGEALRVAQEGPEVAPLPVATRVGVAGEGGASSCDNDQVHIYSTYKRVCMVSFCFRVGRLFEMLDVQR